MMRRMMLRSTSTAVPNPFADAQCVLGLQDFGFGNVPIVIVRRDANNAEDEFTYQQVINGSVASFVGAGNGNAQLLDHTGNGHHALQATITKQPRIVTNGVLNLDLNGNPCVSSDGVDDELSIDIVNTGELISFASSLTHRTTNTFRYFWRAGLIGGTNISNFAFQVSNPNSALRFGVTNGNNFQNIAGSYPPPSQLKLFGIRGTTNQVFVNGVSRLNFAGDLPQYTFINLFNLSSSLYSQIDLNSFVIWNADKSAQRIEIENALN